MNVPDNRVARAPQRPPNATALGAAAFCAVTLFWVHQIAPGAVLVLVLDAAMPAAVLLAAAGWGAWPARWLARDISPLRHAMLALALGMGVLSAAALALGCAGAMNSIAAWILLAAGGVLGLTWLAASRTAELPAAAEPAPRIVPEGVAPWLHGAALLPLSLSAGVMLAGATLPPGLLWPDDGRGYDVLEYHLQAPREYLEAGRITLLEHNVYASFPQQMEMLYYLLMHLADDPYAAAIPAQLLHAATCVLAVIAVGAFALPGWPRTLAMLGVGTLGWLPYVGCLAYVEGGLLFFSAVAGGLLLGHVRQGVPPVARTLIAAGLCAGLAAGCKYQGIVMTAVALPLAWGIAQTGSRGARLRGAALLAVAAAAAFAPWAARNAAFTGNPLYPFAYSVFGGRGWNDDQAQQWSRGHRLTARQHEAGGMLAVARSELFESSLFSPVLVVAAVAGAVLGPGRHAVFLAIWAAAILAAWAGLTHMPGRFLMPIAVPLGLLASSLGHLNAARGVTRAPFPVNILVGIFGVVLAGGACASGLQLQERYGKFDESFQNDQRRAAAAHGDAASQRPVALSALAGQTELLAAAEALNVYAPHPGVRLWLIGRANVFYIRPTIHYSVVFNRDPWLEYAEGGADAAACVEWLRTRGVTHVVFTWSEIERLRSTYGFSPIVTRAWVAQLTTAGLRAVPTAVHSEEIYEVMPR